jgi:predicted ThiF/HesA family dinucleotide-utilizing enzyme
VENQKTAATVDANTTITMGDVWRALEINSHHVKEVYSLHAERCPKWDTVFLRMGDSICDEMHEMVHIMERVLFGMEVSTMVDGRVVVDKQTFRKQIVMPLL